jgi:hypothetical protein
MSARLWKELEDSNDRRPIVVATLARNLRVALVSGMADRDHGESVTPGGHVADLHPRYWAQAERIRSMALATVELDESCSASALEMMSREVTRMLETLVMAARISSGALDAAVAAECSDSGTWTL